MFADADKKIIDMESEIRKQAGFEDLNEYNFEFENESIAIICQVFGVNGLEIDDLMVTRHLISKKLMSDRERRFTDIKIKQKPK